MSNKEHSALTRVLVDVLYAAAIFSYPKHYVGAPVLCPRASRIKRNAYTYIYRLIDLDIIYVLEFFEHFLMKASQFHHSPQGVILESIYYDYLHLMMLQLLVFFLMNEMNEFLELEKIFCLIYIKELN